jgi:orotate phosphoribosyltransferase-like protein
MDKGETMLDIAQLRESVLDLRAEGLNDDEIASYLGLSADVIYEISDSEDSWDDEDTDSSDYDDYEDYGY